MPPRPATRFASMPARRLKPRCRLSVALTLLLQLAGCSGGVLDPQGPIGAAEKTILLNALTIMLVIVVPTIVVALVFAWWFRASNTRARYRPDWAFSGALELIIWSIPVLVIMFLGGVIWIGSHELDPAHPIASGSKPTEVQVVSLDWKWLFIYPEQGIASVNEVVVPAGIPVHFRLTSASVMNTFFVPQLGGMIYMMNGMATQIWLQADKPGDFYGRSGHFSGDGFSGMRFILRAVTPDAFSAWVEATRRTGRTLDRAAYARLAEQSQDVAPFTYREIDPVLFEAVVRQQIPPGPGPTTGRAGRPDVHPRAEN
jgi:cytochrome o ubiquinol oxidase subunit II